MMDDMDDAHLMSIVCFFFQMSGDKKHQLDDKFVLDLFFSIDCLLRGIHFYQFFFGGVFGISPYN